MVWGGGEVVIGTGGTFKFLLPYLLTLWLSVLLIGRGSRGFA